MNKRCYTFFKYLLLSFLNVIIGVTLSAAGNSGRPRDSAYMEFTEIGEFVNQTLFLSWIILLLFILGKRFIYCLYNKNSAFSYLTELFICITGSLAGVMLLIFLNLMDIHLNIPLYDEILQVIEESDLKRIPPP